MERVTKAGKDYEYSRIARDVLDYLEGCAEKRVVPLKHDAAVFRSRLLQNDSRRLR